MIYVAYQEFFSRWTNPSAINFEDARAQVSTENNLLQNVLNKDSAALQKTLSQKTNPIEASGALFAAYLTENPEAMDMLFPLASSAGVEAAKACLIGSTYINDMELFDATALWLKKRGVNALKKKDVRNHCVANLAVFNQLQRIADIEKMNKSSFKNPSAVNDFYVPMMYYAAHYGAHEVVDHAYGKLKEFANTSIAHHTVRNFLYQALQLLAEPIDSSGRYLSTPAHTATFNMLVDKVENKPSLLFNFTWHPERAEPLVQRLTDKEIEATIKQARDPGVVSACETIRSKRQKHVLNSAVASAGVSASPARKM